MTTYSVSVIFAVERQYKIEADNEDSAATNAARMVGDFGVKMEDIIHIEVSVDDEV